MRLAFLFVLSLLQTLDGLVGQGVQGLKLKGKKQALRERPSEIGRCVIICGGA